MQDWQLAFLHKHQLDQACVEAFESSFTDLFSLLKQAHSGTLVLGLQGAQGSGKTTLADYICTKMVHDCAIKALAVSLDDFYLSQEKRAQLSQSVHPLLSTRGVPGTHDLELAIKTIKALKERDFPVAIPAFDKSIDDIVDRGLWETVDRPLDLLIIEGWCWGLRPQSGPDIVEPCNVLEKEEDPDCIWRSFVNTELATYQSLFALADISVMLKAPSFDCIYAWRKQQENLLRQKKQGSHIMDDDQVARFIQFFQRLTQHALTSYPEQADFVYSLNQKRKVVDIKCKC